MRLDKLDLNLLVILDALLEEVSIKNAAEKVFLTPSATSNALSRLRDYFDDPLLIQMGRNMVLTAKAMTLKKPVRDVLLQIQAITTTVSTFDPASCDRRIVIEAFDSTISLFLNEALPYLLRDAPHMSFDIRLLTPKYKTNLESGITDLLIVPDSFVVPDHESEFLYEDSWSCITWTGNTDLKEDLTLEDYLAVGHAISCWDGDKQLSCIEQLVAQCGYKLSVEVAATGFTLLPPLLVKNRLIATVPTSLAYTFASQYPLRVLNCPLPIPNVVKKIQCRKYHDQDPAITWIRGVLQQVAREREVAKLGVDHH